MPGDRSTSHTIDKLLRSLVRTVIENEGTILEDEGIIHFERHGRTRVYPQDITAAPQLAAAAVANTFGNWGEIIPLNTVPFPFHIIGFCVCTVSAVANYHIQLGYNTINADPGTNMEMGERRFRITTTPIAKQTEMMEIQGQGIPANSRVMGRLKTSTGVADTCNLNVVLTRHIPTSYEPELYPAFPW